MGWNDFLLRLRALANRERVESELDEELKFHLAMEERKNRVRGMSDSESQRRARVKFGGVEQVREQCRDARGVNWLENLARDLRYGARVLRKTPAFTIVAVVSLAIGIGANTAIFSLINAVMIRMLPVEHPEQLVLLTDPAAGGEEWDTTEHGARQLLAYPEFVELRAQSSGVFSGMLAAQSEVSEVDLLPDGGGRAMPVKVRTQMVSGDFFEILGVRAVLGRVFTAEEDKAPGASPVAVVSYGFWQRNFAAQPDIVGATVGIGRGVFRVVGVAPSGFHGILVGSEPDLWCPITMQAQLKPGRDYLKARDTNWLQVMARLAPGMRAQGAESAINITFHQIAAAWAGTLPSERLRRNALSQRIQLRAGGRGASELRGEFSGPLMLLMAMVGAVLLLACVNIANLMLAKANGRRQEIGVRLALGAARPRLIRQLLAESLLVAAGGGAAGILLAVAGARVLLASVARDASVLGMASPLDYRVLLFTATISVVTGFAFGLAPAFRATRLDLNQTLTAGGRSLAGRHGRARSGRMLVIAQVALSMVLVMGAALFMRSLHNLLSENLGYRSDHLTMMRVDPLAAGYEGSRAAALYGDLRQALSVVPGILSVTFSNTGLFGGDAGDHLSIEGSPVRDPEELVSLWTEVGPDYFRTLGIPLLRGREIDATDVSRAAPVCVINEAFLRRFFPQADPIGRHVTDEYPTTRETFEIIGVVADSKEHRPNEQVRPRFYSNLAHPIGKVGPVTYLMRTAADPGGLTLAVRRAIGRVDARLPVLSLRTVDDQIGQRLMMEGLVARLSAFFGMVALFMAAIGLYGTVSYSMSQRTTEIGIRMALGASGGSVVRMVLGEALAMVAIGSAIGLLWALFAGRLVANRLYGLTAFDPIAIGIAGAMVLTAGMMAAYVPARRVLKTDPMVSLKYE